ncbi:hypothetical protein J6590_063370 [Homalodisca vitripennis]|nr:hypothetical protein J6590_063370 [Homalodisca vitripennis]
MFNQSLYFVGLVGAAVNGWLVATLFLRAEVMSWSHLLLLNIGISCLGRSLLGGFPFSATSALASRSLLGGFQFSSTSALASSHVLESSVATQHLDILPRQVSPSFTFSSTLALASSHVLESSVATQHLDILPRQVSPSFTFSSTLALASSHVLESSVATQHLDILPRQVSPSFTFSSTLALASSHVLESSVATQHLDILPRQVSPSFTFSSTLALASSHPLESSVVTQHLDILLRQVSPGWLPILCNVSPGQQPEVNPSGYHSCGHLTFCHLNVDRAINTRNFVDFRRTQRHGVPACFHTILRCAIGKDATKVVGGGAAQSVAVFSLVNFGLQSSILAAQKTFACATGSRKLSVGLVAPYSLPYFRLCPHALNSSTPHAHPTGHAITFLEYVISLQYGDRSQSVRALPVLIAFPHNLISSGCLVADGCSEMLAACCTPSFTNRSVLQSFLLWLFGDACCMLYAFLHQLFSVAELLAVMLLCLERYQVTRHAHMGQCAYMSSLLLMWIASMVWSLLPLLNYGRYGCDAAGIACDLDWRVEYGDTYSLAYNVSYLVLGVLLAVILSYFKRESVSYLVLSILILSSSLKYQSHVWIYHFTTIPVSCVDIPLHYKYYTVQLSSGFNYSLQVLQKLAEVSLKQLFQEGELPVSCVDIPLHHKYNTVQLSSGFNYSLQVLQKLAEDIPLYHKYYTVQLSSGFNYSLQVLQKLAEVSLKQLFQEGEFSCVDIPLHYKYYTVQLSSGFNYSLQVLQKLAEVSLKQLFQEGELPVSCVDIPLHHKYNTVQLSSGFNYSLQVLQKLAEVSLKQLFQEGELPVSCVDIPLHHKYYTVQLSSGFNYSLQVLQKLAEVSLKQLFQEGELPVSCVDIPLHHKYNTVQLSSGFNYSLQVLQKLAEWWWGVEDIYRPANAFSLLSHLQQAIQCGSLWKTVTSPESVYRLSGHHQRHITKATIALVAGMYIMWTPQAILSLWRLMFNVPRLSQSIVFMAPVCAEFSAVVPTLAFLCYEPRLRNNLLGLPPDDTPEKPRMRRHRRRAPGRIYGGKMVEREIFA